MKDRLWITNSIGILLVMVGLLLLWVSIINCKLELRKVEEKQNSIEIGDFRFYTDENGNTVIELKDKK